MAKHSRPTRRPRVYSGDCSIRRAEDVPRDRRSEIQPHAEQAEPGEELHHGQLAHRRRHLRERLPRSRATLRPNPAVSLPSRAGMPRCPRAGYSVVVSDGPQHGAEERHRADIKRQLHRERDRARACLLRHAERVARGCTAARRRRLAPEADEHALHREARGCAALRAACPRRRRGTAPC